MSETPISPLRQRMIEDMRVRKLGPATQKSYVRAVKALSEFLGRSPATATAEDCAASRCTRARRASSRRP
jgi:hypothetical protein